MSIVYFICVVWILCGVATLQTVIQMERKLGTSFKITNLTCLDFLGFVVTIVCFPIMFKYIKSAHKIMKDKKE